MTTEHYEGLSTVTVNIGGEEDRGRLWNKSRESWMYTYNNYLETHDWFIKVIILIALQLPHVHHVAVKWCVVFFGGRTYA